MRRLPLALILAAAALAAGCTASDSSSKDFNEEQEAVAQVVDDLVEAAGEDDGRRVCQTLFAAPLRTAFGKDCQAKVEAAFDDTDTNELSTRDVTVTGTTAKAVVDAGRDEEAKERRTLTLVREDGDWRISALG